MARVKSEGKCNFCHKTFSKQGMARHLKACKTRQAAYEAAAAQAGAAPRKLLYIQAQGSYAPEYWLHLEMPADLTLYALDDFLRGIWLECCGHLSQFRIGETFYSIDAGGDDTAWGPLPGWEDDDFEDDEDFDDEDFEDEGPQLRLVTPPAFAPDDAPGEEAEAGGELGAFPPPLHLIPQDPALTAALSDPDLDADFETLATAMLPKFLTFLEQRDPTSLTDDEIIAFTVREMFNLDESVDVSDIVEQVKVDMGSLSDLMPPLPFLGPEPFDGFGFGRFREESMNVPLGDVLRVGMEFEHEYDFGTTTHLTLRVMGERMGVLVDGRESGIHIMARNDPPEVLCESCGKRPATQVCSYCIWDWDGQAWFCDDCARQHEHYDEGFLPVVNSPRVGMCGYTGGAET